MNDCTYRVGEALAKALEIMVFLDLEPSGGRLWPAEKMLWSEIRFRGPRIGSLTLLVSQRIAEMMAQTIAAQERVSVRDCLDAVQELTNVTCGLILPEISFAQHDVFNLSVPKVHGECTSDQIDSLLADPVTERYCVDNDELAIRLSLINNNP